MNFGRQVRFYVLSAVLLVAAVSHAGVIRYVTSGGGGALDGSSWGNAFAEVRLAFAAAGTGDEIWVAAGTYLETPSTLKTGVSIYGGFAGHESAREERDWQANVVTIDGQNTVYNMFVAGSVSDATIDGLNFYRCGQGPVGQGGAIKMTNSTLGVENCGFLYCRSNEGGAIYMSQSTLTSRHCTYTGNDSWNYGGGIDLLSSSSALVEDCTFTSNHGHGAGGGLSTYMSDLDLRRCRFDGNIGGAGGGLLQLWGGSVSVTDCTFYNNVAEVYWRADYGGGGISVQAGNMTVQNCIFSGNSATWGGGFWTNTGAEVPITNCTVVGNTAAGSNGGGLYLYGGQPPLITNCIFWNNGSELAPGAGTVTHSDVQGGYAGDGNIDSLPGFVAAYTDLHLSPDSPCVDTGTATNAPDHDLDGVSRPQGLGYDMGAYEYYVPPTATPTVTPTSTPTDTPTVTPTATPTETPTSTPSATPTDTPSFTPTAMPTDTPTSTRNELGVDTARWKELP